MTILIRIWPYLAGAVLLVGAYLWVDARGFDRGSASRQPEIAALNETIASVRLTSAKARADDAAHVVAVERAQTAVTEESSNALEAQLSDARAAARAYAARLRVAEAATASNGDSGVPTVPGAPDAPSAASDGGPASIVDAEVCAVAVIKAEVWLAWWRGQEGVAR